MKKTIGKTELTTPSERELALRREFDAPRRLVWDCYSKPELVKRWLGQMPRWSWKTCEMDFRVGGSYRWAWKNEDGGEMGMGGVYKEIAKPVKIVQTEKFDQAWYPGEALETVTFEERGGKTIVNTTVLYESKEALEAVLKSPAADGMESSNQHLEKVLASLQAGGVETGAR
jgi:uncharacterized protein YndB with AHSA1/START domain